MSVRNLVQDKPGFLYGAVSILLVASLLVFYSNSKRSASQSVFFYDLSTGRLVVTQSGAISPAAHSSSVYEYPEGKAGAWVRAAIYKCEGEAVKLREGMTADEVAAAGARIAWLVRYPADIVPLIEKRHNGEDLTDAERNRVARAPKLLATPDELQWVREESTAGYKIKSSLGTLCSTGVADFVTP